MPCRPNCDSVMKKAGPGASEYPEAVRQVDTTQWRADDDPWQPPIRQLLRDQVREWQQEAERIKRHPT